MGGASREAKAHRVPAVIAVLGIVELDDDDGLLAGGGDMQMDRGAHHLPHVDPGLDPALLPQERMLRPDAERDGAALHILCKESLPLALAQRDTPAVQLHAVALPLPDEHCVKKVHDGRADKARDKEVCRVVEDLLGRADLLDVAVLHDDDAVAQGHGLGLVMGDIDKGRIDAFSELDDLGPHLVAELGIEVTQRLVHEHDLRGAHDGAADGDALALAAGERPGLAVEIVRDIEDLGGLPHLLVDDIPPLVPEREGEGHVLIHGHVREEGIILKDHGDVALLGVNIVHELAVVIELPVRDLLQPRDHAQGGGFAAARGADQDDELLVRDVQIEALHRDDPLLRDLEIAALRPVPTGLSQAPLFLRTAEAVDLFYIMKADACHVFPPNPNQSTRSPLP